MSSYSLYSVGDSCITLALGNNINETTGEKVMAMQKWIQFYPFKGLNDVVIAYNSISLLYDPVAVKLLCGPNVLITSFIRSRLLDAYTHAVPAGGDRTIIRIPVCYDPVCGPDLKELAQVKQLSSEEVVRLHTGSVYRVYMIGFLPGFPYMASVPDEIAAPRKKQPAQIAAGSVGIAGIQTGIYPLASPGGWQIVGRTPQKVFTADHILLKTGNYVQFYAITKEEFLHWPQQLQ